MLDRLVLSGGLALLLTCAGPRWVQANEEPHGHEVADESHGGCLHEHLQIAFIADVGFAYFSANEPLMTGHHDPHHSGFFLQQLALKAGATVTPHIRLHGSVTFGLEHVEIEEVFASFHGLPLGVDVTAGQYLTPFGAFNPTHLPDWAFLDQPLVLGKFFGGVGSRGMGVQIKWQLPVPWQMALVGSATSASSEGARSFWGEEELEFEGFDDLLYVASLKQRFPVGGPASLSWGLSGAFGPSASGPGARTEILGTDLVLALLPGGEEGRFGLTWQTELMMRYRHTIEGTDWDWGGYTYVVCRLARRWEVGTRYELVSGLDGDPFDPEWTGYRQRASADVTFRPVHRLRVRLQGNLDPPTSRSDPWQYGVMLAFEVLAGKVPHHDH